MDFRLAKSNRAVVIAAVLLTIALGVTIHRARLERAKVEAIRCGNQMVAIGLSARSWANDHDEHLPTNFLAMSTELVHPRILFCPTDTKRTVPNAWSEFRAENCSYEILTPGLLEGDTNHVYFRCRMHGFTIYGNGACFDGERRILKRSFRD